EFLNKHGIDIDRKLHILKQFHVTLQFYGKKPTAKIIENFDEGKEVDVCITGYAKNDKCIALICDKSTLAEYLDDRTPHITYALSEGTKPFYSNELLRNNKHILFDTPFCIKGTLERVR
ncbi:hypothetical protein EBX93_18375, partial [bacterium]|nr:hypothetical protein [bacterium]